jgi:hypothetical protein
VTPCQPLPLWSVTYYLNDPLPCLFHKCCILISALKAKHLGTIFKHTHVVFDGKKNVYSPYELRLPQNFQVTSSRQSFLLRITFSIIVLLSHINAVKSSQIYDYFFVLSNSTQFDINQIEKIPAMSVLHGPKSYQFNCRTQSRS